MKLCLNCMELYEGEYDVCPYCGYSGGENDSHLLSRGYQLSNRYIIGSVLSQEAGSVTYLAWDRILNMKVDVVEYRPEHSEDKDAVAGKRNFVSRAAALAQFNDNPNFVTVYSIIKDKGTAYIIKEHLEGQTLREYTSAFIGKRSRKKASAILRKIIAILQKLNEAGFSHNGVNPDNIIVDEKGEPKLTVIGTETEEELILPEWLQNIARSGLKLRKNIELDKADLMLKAIWSKEKSSTVVFALIVIISLICGYFAVREMAWTVSGSEVLSYCICEKGNNIGVVAEVRNTKNKVLNQVVLGEYETEGETYPISSYCNIQPGETKLLAIEYENVTRYKINKAFTYTHNFIEMKECYTHYVDPVVAIEGGKLVLYNENAFTCPDGYIVAVNRDENGKIISCDVEGIYPNLCDNKLNSGRNVCDISLKYDENSELYYVPDYCDLMDYL